MNKTKVTINQKEYKSRVERLFSKNNKAELSPVFVQPRENVIRDRTTASQRFYGTARDRPRFISFQIPYAR